MVVFALLGAAFADQVWGQSRASGEVDGRTQHAVPRVGTSDTAPGTSGMITAQTRHPAGPHAQTTTARDL
jgi:hypothetical protein